MYWQAGEKKTSGELYGHIGGALYFWLVRVERTTRTRAPQNKKGYVAFYVWWSAKGCWTTEMDINRNVDIQCGLVEAH